MKQSTRKLIFILMAGALTVVFVNTAMADPTQPPPAPWASDQPYQMNENAQVQSSSQENEQRRYDQVPPANILPPSGYGYPNMGRQPYTGQGRPAPQYGYGNRQPYRAQGYGYRPPYPGYGNRPPNPRQGYGQRRNNSPWDRMSRGMPWNDWDRGGRNEGWGPDFGEGKIFTSSPERWFRGQDGIADLWDDMLEAPSRFGEMPGGWTAPSISVPNPVDVGDQFGEASKEVPDFVQEIPDMFEWQN